MAEWGVAIFWAMVTASCMVGAIWVWGVFEFCFFFSDSRREANLFWVWPMRMTVSTDELGTGGLTRVFIRSSKGIFLSQPPRMRIFFWGMAAMAARTLWGVVAMESL